MKAITTNHQTEQTNRIQALKTHTYTSEHNLTDLMLMTTLLDTVFSGKKTEPDTIKIGEGEIRQSQNEMSENHA